jgi:hypothetical protein
MRQMFTSPRLANVEGVQKLLEDAGIETKITEGRSWKGNSRREFSYRQKDDAKVEQPAVWVLKSEDYTRALEILHEAGLIEVGAAPRDTSYLPETLQFAEKRPLDAATRISRVRIALLAIVAAMGGWMVLRMYLLH